MGTKVATARHKSDWRWILGQVFLVAIFLLVFAHKINLVTTDLGRHLKNGEILTKQGTLISTNFYSYTHPNFETTNHHWGSGVIFYLVWTLAGFVGLHVFAIVASLLTYLIFLILAKNGAGIGVALIASLVAIPLIGQRTEIRPEIFSYLFVGITLFLLEKVTKLKIVDKKTLFLLFVVQLLWVNTHVYFFLAPLILGVFALGELVKTKDLKLVVQKYWPAGVVITTASLANPRFVRGVLEPLLIFQNYGYQLVENKSIWYLQKYFGQSMYFSFKVLALVFLGMLALVVYKGKLSRLIPPALLGLFVMVFAGVATRNMALAGYMLIFAIALLVAPLLSKSTKKIINTFAPIIVGISAAFVLLTGSYKLLPNWREAGIGLETDNMAAIEFIRSAGLNKPIFNNYDTGGYLIYGLYPEYKVFVDNRPEAYPASFFEQTYVPMQLYDEVWKEKDRQYAFNTIIINHTDFTQWGRTLIKKRIADEEWAVVYLDKRIVIFVKDNDINAEIVEKYALEGVEVN